MRLDVLTARSFMWKMHCLEVHGSMLHWNLAKYSPERGPICTSVSESRMKWP